MGSVPLRPTLQAAFALAGEFGSFSPILKGVAEGNLSVLARLFGACGFPGTGTDLFTVPGRSLASRLVELRPIAGELVLGLMGVDPDAKEERRPAKQNTKPTEPLAFYESLFGFATGILRWTPEATWNTTPGEIIAAMEFRADANMAPEERKKKQMASMSLADRARFTFATLGTRTETDADADAE